MTNVLKRNNVTVIGDGKNVMLFAHGLGCDQNSWKYIRNDFTPDYKLVLFDYVGAGNSDLKIKRCIIYRSFGKLYDRRSRCN